MTPSECFLKPDPAIESAIPLYQRGQSLFQLMDAHPSPGIFSKKGAYARVMEWSMKDPAFKAQLFRFVERPAGPFVVGGNREASSGVSR